MLSKYVILEGNLHFAGCCKCVRQFFGRLVRASESALVSCLPFLSVDKGIEISNCSYRSVCPPCVSGGFHSCVNESLYCFQMAIFLGNILRSEICFVWY